MTFRPVPRKGTVKLLQLTQDAEGKEIESRQELLEYIGRLEQSELVLLGIIGQLIDQFDGQSFEERVF